MRLGTDGTTSARTRTPRPPGRSRRRAILWLVVLGWLLIAGASSPYQSRLRDVESNSAAAFLPRSAESTQVSRLLKERFPDGDSLPALVVHRRPGGLTEADRRAVLADVDRLRAVPGTQRPVAPFTADGRPTRGLVSRDASVAVTVVPVSATKGRAVRDTVESLRDALHPPHGVTTEITGPAGISADAIAVFGDVDLRLLLATAGLVLALLLVVYRSPLLAFIPLVVVGFAYVLAAGVVYALAAHGGMLVNNQAVSLMLILMFGAGTDYCLLLTARYQEELRSDPEPRAAMVRAVRRAWPAVLFSGLTVMASLAALFAARLGSTRVLGPVGIVGTGCVLLGTFTLLPALLVLFGHRPLLRRAAGKRGTGEPAGPSGRPRGETEPAEATETTKGASDRTPAGAPEGASAGLRGGEAAVAAGSRPWRRVVAAVFRRPVWAVGATLAFFAAGSAGLASYTEDMSMLHAFRAETSSAAGYRAISEAFPAGTAAPTTVLVERVDGPLRESDLTRAARQVRSVPDVASATVLPARSADGRIGQLRVVLDADPYDATGLARISAVREALDGGLPTGVRAMTGGDPAVQLDTKHAADRDLRLIVPLVLVIVLALLIVLLRALVAPLYLIATVIVSFFGAFGISVFVFRELLGQHGLNPVEPTFAFLFLVALGVDYNIFLMARVREETRHRDTRTAMRTALLTTGSVITSAGVILAGTFSMLMILPLVMLFQLGFTVALGVLLDTVLVRVVLVPAITWLLGERAWWPAGRSGPTRERS
ncbi:MMPL family transporter [Streptomyces sp. LX-29]|uniref:MMPL family transporter n=1 Tax=Streptomyces sp. LX-29 TaxID=2900152 RepID=UPI00240D4796|nr:MMPL family transporter [Streptomyces sp. LX-29]WFB10802.1 MMPL family transporter [Streptomyces sp. LX-29]